MSIKEIGSVAEFEQLATEGGTVIFTGSWCNPCKVLKQKLESGSIDLEALEDTEHQLRTVDISKLAELAGHYQVRTLPTVIKLAAGGEVIKRGASAIVNELDAWFPITNS